MATLREKFKEYKINGTDTPVFIHDRGTDMAVSPRYLEGGWQEVLDKEVAWDDGYEFYLEK